MTFLEYKDRAALTQAVADALGAALSQALASRDTVSMAVPGGTTPGPIFDALSARADIDWSRVTVMLSDERWVPETHAQSNTRLIKARLLTGPAKAAAFIPFFRAGLSPEDGCAAVAPLLAPHLPLCMLMLGMGADMHTASLFPGAAGTQDAMAAEAPALCPVRVAGQDIARVTLPAPVLQAARATHLVIFGQDKRAALAKAQTLPPATAPVAAVLGGATVHYAP